MTTTYTQFTPTTNTAFSFQATLDGESYNVVLTYNLVGQRYYVTIYDLSGNLIVSRGLVTSTATNSATFSWADGIASVSTSQPHGIALGSVARVTVSNTGGSGYDGVFPMLSTGSTSLQYALPANPAASGGNVTSSASGSAPTTVSGTVEQNISFPLQKLDGSYFSSTLVYRSNTEQFEVSP